MSPAADAAARLYMYFGGAWPKMLNEVYIQFSSVTRELHSTSDMRNEVHSVFFFFFYKNASNFVAEAECSYIFLRFKAENVLKMFLNCIVYTTCISVNQCGSD